MPHILLKWTLPALALAVVCYYAAHIYLPANVSAEITAQLVQNARLPRILVGILCGAVLAVSGLLLQTMTRNPLASPSLLSINAGAGLGVIVLTSFSPAILGGVSLSLAAAVGGALSWSLVMWISYQGGRLQQNRLILAGIAVSAFCLALGKASMIIAEDQANGVINWLAGGMVNMRWEKFHDFWPFVLLPLVPLIWLIPKLNLLRLSDEAAQSLGLSVKHLRLLINLIVLVWVGASVATTGPIAFIGLLVPHITKFWIGYDLRMAVPMCALLGALLLTAADLLAFVIAYPAQLQAGAVIAILGAPCFVILAKRRIEK